MARARIIKPGFFVNDELAEVSPLGRLLFAGLWTIADREGRLEDRPKKIKAEILPYDDADVDSLLCDLSVHGFIVRYSVGGNKYIQIEKFSKHQTPHKAEKDSEIPPVSEADDTCNMQEQKEHSTSTVQEQDKNNTNPSLTFNHNHNLYTLTLNQNTLTSNPLPVTSNDCADAQSRAREDKPAENLWKRRFKEFWDAYPNKTGKGAAEKAYLKIKPTQELHETMIRAVRAASLSRQWKKDGGQFIPNPATWLNQRRWEDEIPQETIFSEKADIADRAISMLESLEGNKNDEGSRCC